MLQLTDSVLKGEDLGFQGPHPVVMLVLGHGASCLHKLLGSSRCCLLFPSQLSHFLLKADSDHSRRLSFGPKVRQLAIQRTHAAHVCEVELELGVELCPGLLEGYGLLC